MSGTLGSERPYRPFGKNFCDLHHPQVMHITRKSSTQIAGFMVELGWFGCSSASIERVGDRIWVSAAALLGRAINYRALSNFQLLGWIGVDSKIGPINSNLIGNFGCANLVGFCCKRTKSISRRMSISKRFKFLSV